jgi:CO/xanthine dehydrogenase FAD-binding subunit
MKPAPFDYVRATSVAQVCALLAEDEDARLIAGGQTLIPMLAMRLARPTRLIDIARIVALDCIADDGEAVTIGAATRQVTALRSARVAAQVPLLAAALPFVGHAATRSRGTIGGSIAHADPAAEIPLVVLTLGAELLVEDVSGTRVLPTAEFFLGPMLTALPARAVLTAVRLPALPRGRVGVSFLEVSARRGDFALVAAAAQVVIDDDGRCISAAAGIGGACATPVRLDVAALLGTMRDEQRIAEIIDAATAGLDTMADLQASASYRRRVAATLARRALLGAWNQAAGGEHDARHARH